ncbi:hypothetical protein UFOVP920_6 [uncultured Caudovirales phage]|uniref:Uncharacterized protein n=1 Tax=uncultured Caudovirales phage TaxID=2100421 RepID=A0A6J7XFH0_9CAUD|nr:hypothetical protein UFOVP920_6 [uncultured Caudovirales phage]CAB4199716.1 hypothetical protein UFOVP1345_6 [uncultured Caudovirales phage]CAB5228602.1 hypothetical protein UFOVP1542_6 [uncultured Caudovirales phage]
MRYVVEFGNRGGAHTDNLVLPTRKAAEILARKLVMVFTNDPHANGATDSDWVMWKGCARMTWKSAAHFVAISKLDGVPRGSASGGLWKKPTGPELLSDTVCEWSARDSALWGAP